MSVSLGERLARVRDALVETVYPPTCAGCGLRGTWLCNRCAAETLPTNTPITCLRCGTPRLFGHCDCDELPASISATLAVVVYHGWVAEAIKALKYHHEMARAAFLGGLMAAHIPSIGRVDALIPVPLHPSRLASRGYNQAELLANVISRDTGIPVANVLRRTRNTGTQTKLGGDERHANVADAFAMRSGIGVYPGAHVVIIDDVRTTGATIGACAAALAVAKPARVCGMTFALDLQQRELQELQRLKATGYR